MITMEDLQDPGLKEEITEEASRYGSIVSVSINIVDTQQPHIVLQYENVTDALLAFQNLNGRYFAGRKVTATLI